MEIKIELKEGTDLARRIQKYVKAMEIEFNKDENEFAIPVAITLNGAVLKMIEMGLPNLEDFFRTGRELD